MVVPLEEPIAALVEAARRLVALADAAPPPGAVVAGEVLLDLATGELRWRGQRVVLAPGQLALAAALLSSPGVVLPRPVLLAALGYRPGVRTRALDSAVCRLRRRLPGEIASVPGCGYRWTPPRL